MTCIIHGLSTKRQLRDYIAHLNQKRQSDTIQMTFAPFSTQRVWIEDPSITRPRDFLLEDMPLGTNETVTNHPKRSWFARIERTFDGIWKVV